MQDFEPQQKFLVGIDSDGCVFDTMELKHKECFIPNFVNFYDLQGVSKYARNGRRDLCGTGVFVSDDSIDATAETDTGSTAF